MTATDTRPVIRARTSDIVELAEFLSLLLDAPIMITAAGEEVAAPEGRHLILVVAESAP